MKKTMTILAIFMLLIINVVAEILKIQILSTADCHANIQSKKSGLVYINNLIDRVKLEKNDKQLSFLVSNGDLIQGNATARIDKGAHVIDAFNLMNYDFFVIGNHDFDFGFNNLFNICKKINANTLSANFISNSKNIKPYKIITHNNLKIAFIGLTEEKIRYRLLPNVEKYFIDKESALIPIIRELRRANVDIIVLLQHDGIYYKGGNLFQLIKKFPEIDLVFGGHTHIPNGGTKIINSYYIQAPAYANSVAEAIITYDTNERQIDKISSRIHPLSAQDIKEVDKKFAPILAKTNRLKAIASKTKKFDKSYFKKEFSFYDNMVYSKMKKVCPNGDFYLYSYNIRIKYFINLDKYSLYNEYFLFPYEDKFIEVEVTYDELQAILEEKIALHKKYKNKLFTYKAKNFKPTDKIKLVSSTYMLSGEGDKYSKTRKIISEKLK